MERSNQGREIHTYIAFLNIGTSQTRNVIRIIHVFDHDALEVMGNDSNIMPGGKRIC